MDGCCGQAAASEECRCRTDAESLARAVHDYVRRRVRHPQDAEDVTQEALARLYRGVDDLLDAAALEGWMYRVAANAVVDHYRAGPRRPVPVDPDDLDVVDPGDPGDAGDPGDSGGNALAGCLPVLLGRLPDDYRRALELTDLGGATQQDAASAAGLSTSGMKSRVQRGRRLLRAEVRRCCEVVLDGQGALVESSPRPTPASAACRRPEPGARG